jgi:hypothetical protein
MLNVLIKKLRQKNNFKQISVPGVPMSHDIINILINISTERKQIQNRSTTNKFSILKQAVVCITLHEVLGTKLL